MSDETSSDQFSLVKSLFVFGLSLTLVVGIGAAYGAVFSHTACGCQPAVAGVDIEQNSTHLTVTAVSMKSADTLYVNDSTGDTQATLTEVGEKITFIHNGSDSEYVVVAGSDGTRNVVQTYTVQ